VAGGRDVFEEQAVTWCDAEGWALRDALRDALSPKIPRTAPQLFARVRADYGDFNERRMWRYLNWLLKRGIAVRLAPLYFNQEKFADDIDIGYLRGTGIEYPRDASDREWARLTSERRWLIRAKPSEVRAIPEVDDVNDLPPWVPQGARWLVGFSMNSAASTPRRTLSSGRRELRALNRQFEGWTRSQRERVACQVTKIRHWQIIEGDYTRAPDLEATWFVDPPYAGRPGSHYTHGSSRLDYQRLGSWCRARCGQVVVCEANGAAWLPFVPLGDFHAMGARRSHEAMWTANTGPRQLAPDLEAAA
jgi:hypothetical protein